MKTAKLSFIMLIASAFLYVSPVLAMLTVNVSPSGSGLIGSYPGTIYCESCSSEEFTFGESVILTAYYNPGYQFDHWEGDLSGTENPGTLIMDGVKSVTAVFVPVSSPQTLTVNVSPAGSGKVGSWPGNIYCESCSDEFPSGQEVILTAYFNDGYQFDHWEGDLNDTVESVTLIMDNPKTVTAVFVPTVTPQTLTVNVSPANSGKVGSDPGNIYCESCSDEFPSGQEVILTAYFNDGYQFDHWEGDLDDTVDSVTLIMDSAKTVTAVFVPVENPQTLSVSVQPAEAGIVSSWPEGILCPDGACDADFPQGTEVIVTAQYNSGFVFDHWEGDLSGTLDSDTLFMDAPKSVTAVFVPVVNPQTLIVDVQPFDGGIVGSWPEGIWCPEGACEWDFPQGEEVSLTPYPNSGYQFDHWESNTDGAVDSEVFISDSAQMVTAVFVPVENPQTLTVTVSPPEGGYIGSSPEGIWCPDDVCEWDFPSGADVELYAGINPGFRFDHWEGDLTGTEASQKITLTGPKSVTAVFIPFTNPEKLNVNISPAGSGFVDSDPFGISCPETCQSDFIHGEDVFLVATPEDGYFFDHWQGALSGSENADYVLMDGAKTVTAVFAQGMEFPQELTPTGTELTDLNAVSFTYWPVNPDSRTIFGEDVAQNYGKDFRMGAYDPVKGGYNEYGPDLKIEPGRGLWFLSRYPYLIKIKGTPVSVTEDFDLPLLYNPATGDGWNMISCPNDARYDWNAMEILADGQKLRISDPGSENYISLRFWKWVEGDYVFYDAEGPLDNEQYPFDPDPVLKPFESYWVRVRKANVTLRFPVSAQVDVEYEPADRSVAGKRRSSSAGETPPSPIGGFDQNSAAVKDSVGGCFVSSLFGE